MSSAQTQQYQQQAQPQQMQQPMYQQQPFMMIVHDDGSDGTALCLMIGGFFFALLSWINVCLHINSPNRRSKQYAKVSLIYSIVQIVIIVSFMMIIAVTYSPVKRPDDH